MTFVHNQHDLDFGIDVKQSLYEERVRDLILLTFVVLEARTVVESHLLNDYFGGDGGLGVLLVANFDAILFDSVESGFESVEADDEFRTTEEGHDGTLADTSITDHNDCFLVLSVDWNRLHACVD